MPIREMLSSQLWTIEWSLENILGELEDRNMARDCYEFIMIHGTPERILDILDMVADASSKPKVDLA